MKYFAPALALAASVLATQASAQAMECTMSSRNNTGGMPPVFLIEYAPNQAQALVAHGWTEGPVSHAVAATRSGNRLSMSVSNQARVNGRTAVVHFSMTYRFAEQTLSVAAAAGSGFTGNMRARYACSPL